MNDKKKETKRLSRLKLDIAMYLWSAKTDDFNDFEERLEESLNEYVENVLDDLPENSFAPDTFEAGWNARTNNIKDKL